MQMQSDLSQALVANGVDFTHSHYACNVREWYLPKHACTVRGTKFGYTVYICDDVEGTFADAPAAVAEFVENLA